MVKKKGAMIPLRERCDLIDKADHQMSIRKQCDLLSISKSSFYYVPQGPSDKDLTIMRKIDELYLEDPTRGTRRYCDDLALEGVLIGRAKARTLMTLMDIHAIYCKPKTTLADKRHYKYPYLLRNLSITHANHVWEIDISYIPMKKGFMYLCAIIDVYSRMIVGWSISNNMDAQWVIDVVKAAVLRYGKPDIINSDQGSQFTSEIYVNYIKSLEHTVVSMNGKGRATDNVYIERFFRTIKYDKIYIHVPVDGLDLYQLCETFINFYNNRRSHSEVGKVPPSLAYKRAA
jgi:putative transposase